MNRKQTDKLFLSIIGSAFSQCDHKWIKNKDGKEYCFNCLRDKSGLPLVYLREEEQDANL